MKYIVTTGDKYVLNLKEKKFTGSYGQAERYDNEGDAYLALQMARQVMNGDTWAIQEEY